MHRLTVENFGPIKERIVFEPKDFSIIIGEQASGKSIIAKLVFLFRSLRDDIMKWMYEESDRLSKANINRVIRDKFLKFFGRNKPLPSGFYMKYEYSDGIYIELTSRKEDGLLWSKLSNGFVKKFNGIINHRRKISEEIKRIKEKKIEFLTSAELYQLEEEERRLLRPIEEQINTLFNDSYIPIYIPAGRAVLNFLEEVEIENMDFLMSMFIKRVVSSKRKFSESLESLIESEKGHPADEERVRLLYKVAGLVYKILKAEYRYEKGKEFLLLQQESEKIPLQFASSGQQEVLWILLLLFQIMLENRKVFLVIEEPEAHLFPTAQTLLIEYISAFLNLTKSHVLITTHSPYILSFINVLLLRAKANINYPFLIPMKKIGAWYRNLHEFTSIIDAETKLIKDNAIDDVSETIAEELEELEEAIYGEKAQSSNNQ